MRSGWVRVAVVLGLCVMPVSGCNCVLSVTPGELTGGGGSGGGGAGGSAGAGSSASSAGGSGGTGGCGQYDGTASVQWSDLGGANLPSITFQASQSVSAVYNSGNSRTEITIGAYPPGYCAAGAHIYLAGRPMAGQSYAIVDLATFNDPVAFSGGPNVFIDTGAHEALPNSSDCDDMKKDLLFGSVAGQGSFTVPSFAGTTLQFLATGVQAVPYPGEEYGGEGTLGVEIDGVAECYYEQ